MSALKAPKKEPSSAIKKSASGNGRATTPGERGNSGGGMGGFSSFTESGFERSSTSAGGGGNDDTSLRVRNQMLEKDLERRQESYIARERAYKARIEDLEEELNAQRSMKTGWMKTYNKMEKIRSFHGEILNNVELVQDRTARILQDQERDLLRAFRARLFDVQTELEKEKSKKDDGAGAWIERSRQLEAEVEWAKEVADRLERVNQALTQENTRLKSQFHSQETDRNYIIETLGKVRRENEQLRSERVTVEASLAEAKAKIEQLSATQVGLVSHKPAVSSSNAAGAGGAGAGGGGAATSGSAAGGAGAGGKSSETNEERYREMNSRLNRLLREERHALAVTRQNYAAELRSRTEIELLLRQCVEEVRKEIAKKHIESAYHMGAGRGGNGNGNAAGGGQQGDFTKLYTNQHHGGAGAKKDGGAGVIPVEDFTQEDRERVLELLLSQERVVTLLYAKAFPVNPTGGGGGAGVGAGGTGALGKHVGGSAGGGNVLLGLSGANEGGADGLGMNMNMNTSASENKLPHINGATGGAGGRPKSTGAGDK